MYPTLVADDILIVSDQRKLNIGDIISFYSEHSIIITHRIIKFNAEFVTTKGDNRWKQDKPVNLDQVIGVIRQGIRVNKKGASVRIDYSHKSAPGFFYRLYYFFLTLRTTIS